MDSQPVEVSNQQIEAVLHESAQLAAGLRRARRVRLVLFLAIVVFLGGAGWVAYAKASDFASPKNLNRLGEEARASWEQRQDFYMKQAQMLLDKLSPPLSKAFSEQATKDTPKFLKAVEKERQPFLDHLQDEFSKRLNKRLTSMQPRYINLLKEEFPTLKDAKRQAQMAENVTAAVEKLVKKYYVDQLRDEVLMLYNAWDTFPPAAAAARGEASLEEQFVEALLKLGGHRLTHPLETPFDE
jgi:hypothetical protein